MSSSSSLVFSRARRSCLQRFALVWLWVAVFSVPPLAASYKESYRAGIEAVDRERWDDVARYMHAAIAEQPRAGERVKIYGMRFEPYLPYFYLGLALYELGNWSGAVAAWESSERQGAVRGPQLKTLRKRRKVCERRLALEAASLPRPPPPSPADVPAVTSPTPPPAESGTKLKSSAGTAPETTAPEVPELRREAGNIADVKDAAQSAVPAGAEVEPFHEDNARGQEKPARERKKAAPPRDPRLREVRETPPARPSPGVPPLLRDAAKAFFEANYQQTLAVLRGSELTLPKERATAHLLSAAARYSLYLEAGGQDSELRQAAAEDVTACRKLDPQVVPDTSLFSPAFAMFFRTVGQ